MRIIDDDLTGPEINALLAHHFASMFEHSPPESCHVLPVAGLRAPGISVWSIWDGDTLAGCGALRQIDDRHGEIKSMRTAGGYLKRGVGAAMLAHILTVARARGYRRLSLETGTPDAFQPARRLYARHGFTECAPFGDYAPDPYSVFMTLALD